MFYNAILTRGVGFIPYLVLGNDAFLGAQEEFFVAPVLVFHLEVSGDDIVVPEPDGGHSQDERVFVCPGIPVAWGGGEERVRRELLLVIEYRVTDRERGGRKSET